MHSGRDPGPATATRFSTSGLDANPQETFSTLWSEALRKFQQSSSVDPNRWDAWLLRISSCHNVDGVLRVLDETMQRLEHFRLGNPSWRDVRNKYLKPAVQVLLLFNDALTETASCFPAVPGGKAIFVAIGVLLEATNGVSERCEALVGLFEELNFYMERLRIRLAMPSGLGPASKTMSITILAQMLEVVSIATKLLAPSAWRTRLTLYRHALTRDKTMQDALDRLHTLTDLEARAIAAETQVTVAETQVAVSKTRIAAEETRDSVTEMQTVLRRMEAEIALMYQELLRTPRSELPPYTSTDASNPGVLEKLDRVGSADIDAQNSNGCLEGTRVGVLTDLQDWSRDAYGPKIFWLDGMAGTGKSAIARSFCFNLRRDGLLGGSFFCSHRGATDQSDARRIIPTLAISLALFDWHFNMSLLSELDKYPYLNDWNPKTQVKHLLSAPLAALGAEKSRPPILVIDALDECSEKLATYDVLVALVDAIPALPVKLFLTSRPEPHVRENLERLQHLDPPLGRVLRLHDIDRHIVEADIRLYLNHGLQNMRKTFAPSFVDWPSELDVSALTRLSDGLFIYAFTALMYVHKNPVGRLAKLTGAAIPAAGPAMTKALDDIYQVVLSEAMDPCEYEPDEIEQTRLMIAHIVNLRAPLMVASLAQLLAIPALSLRASLDRLHAVIYVPTHDDRGILSTFHASFGDFLSSRSHIPDMNPYISESHVELAAACIRALNSDKLCFNISQACTSYLPNDKQKLARVENPLRYACLYCAYHIASATSDIIISALEKAIVGPKFLFWLEALSAMGATAEDIIDMLDLVLTKCTSYLFSSRRFTEFMLSAKDFVRTFGPAITRSAPHIYLSALAFSPKESVVRKVCLPSFTKLAQTMPQDARYSSDSFGPTCAVFSPDGRHFAVGFDDDTIRIWDTESGVPVSPALVGHDDSIACIAFSPVESGRLVSGSEDQELRLWDTGRSANHTPPLGDHADVVTHVAFSPDGCLIASSSADGTILLWNAGAGTQSRAPLVGHTDIVTHVAFSPDGKMLASGSRDCSVLLWDTETGLCVREPMKGHSQWVMSVAFTPNGRRILSGARDGTVCAWSVGTSALLAVYTPLKCHSHWIRSTTVVLNSPEMEITQFDVCAECTSWDENEDSPSTLTTKHELPEEDYWVRALAFCSDGRRVAIGANDWAVRVWDLETNALVCPPSYGHSAMIRSVSFAPDGHRVISCADDGTIRIWCTDLGLLDSRVYSFGGDTSLSLLQYPSEGAASTAPSSTSKHPQFQLATSEDGWIVDTSCNPPRLLLWLPEELRSQTYFPSTHMIMAPHTTFHLGLSNFAHGARWFECSPDTSMHTS